MSTAVADPLLGRLLDGRYEVRRRIAVGGMATVYAALDTRLDRPVAVKVMHPALAADVDFVARFRREAKAAARLSSPAVVSVSDQGADGGVVFLVMELVEGRTLRDLLRARGPLPPAEALSVLEPVLEALTAAHEAGYVHRDVKPENVLIADDGRVKVGDFGLARAVDASPLTATTGLLIGTVAYLAPEQVRRGVADARTDVYAFGVLLFEVLTGRPPFEGDTALSVAYQHLHERVPAPSSVRPGIPEELDELVIAATEPDPDDRPTNAGELLADVQRLAAIFGATRRPQLLTSFESAEGPADDAIDLDAPAFLDPPRGDEPEDDEALSVRHTEVIDGARRTGPVEEKARSTRKLGGWLRWLLDRRPLGRLSGGAKAWLALLLVTLLAIGGAWWLAVGRGTPVPKVVGLQPAAAEQAVRNVGLTPKIDALGVFSETVPRGLIADADPSPGHAAHKHGTVILRPSRGPERYVLPDLKGQPLADATQRLRQLKLQVGATSHRNDDAVAAGSVLSSDPAPGAVLKPDTRITLVISDGPAPVTAPDVKGKPADDAQRTLEQLGLRVTRKTVNSDDVPAQKVIDLQPATGLHRTDQVTLVVSLGPEMVPIPNVEGQSRRSAVNTLESAGFKVRVLNVPGFDSYVARIVPSAGTKARRGSTVTIVLV